MKRYFKLIALFTNLFFFFSFSVADRVPSEHALGAFVIIVPVIGSLHQARP